MNQALHHQQVTATSHDAAPDCVQTRLLSDAMHSSREPRKCLADIRNEIEDPLFVMDESRTLLYLNHAAERILRANVGFKENAGKPAPSAFSSDVHLSRLLASLQKGEKQGSSHAIRINRRSASKDWFVIVSALPNAQDAYPRTMFLIHPVGRMTPRKMPTHAIRELFGLTRRELGVINGILRNHSLREIATQMSLSHETIRSYLKTIFRKCEVTSQVQLVTLLCRLATFHPNSSLANRAIQHYTFGGSDSGCLLNTSTRKVSKWS